MSKLQLFHGRLWKCICFHLFPLPFQWHSNYNFNSSVKKIFWQQRKTLMMIEICLSSPSPLALLFCKPPGLLFFILFFLQYLLRSPFPKRAVSRMSPWAARRCRPSQVGTATHSYSLPLPPFCYSPEKQQMVVIVSLQGMVLYWIHVQSVNMSSVLICYIQKHSPCPYLIFKCICALIETLPTCCYTNANPHIADFESNALMLPHFHFKVCLRVAVCALLTHFFLLTKRSLCSSQRSTVQSFPFCSYLFLGACFYFHSLFILCLQPTCAFKQQNQYLNKGSKVLGYNIGIYYR